MEVSRDIDAMEDLLPDGAFEGIRLLGGNNNNNNNQGNNNYNNYNNQNSNSSSSYSDYSFNEELFLGTVGLCVLGALLVVFRVKCHRKKERKRKKLGLSRKTKRRRKRSVTKSFDDDDASLFVTDDEIRKFVLPSKQEASIQEAAKVVRCDKETNRIMDLCKPFWLSAFVSGVCDVINSALVGKELGVEALTIYYIVTVPATFSGTIIYSVLETVTSLGGQAIGVGSYKLTGQYCQISIILYTILYIPHAVFWIFYLKPCLKWFAPDLSDDVINEGYDYFLVSLVATYLDSFSSILHSLLDVADHYRYSMYSSVLSEIAGVGTFIAYLKINPYTKKSIVWVEVIDTVLSFLWLIGDILIVKHMKWFKGFSKGMIRSVAMKNWEAVWLVLKTAAPLSVGNILLTVEWELLAIFAAGIGETYVAAWGLVGTVWGVLEYATDCVAAAGEIRVAKLLGNGNPRLAKLSSYKCLFLGNLFAVLMSISFLAGLPVIPRWFTDDQLLQTLISNLLPYCALGNLTLTVGSLSWTLVGAQGRYSIATFHGCIGSLGVTIPCAVLSIYYLDFGLPGLAASVVLGYMVSGSFNTITLILSDWEYIAYRVMLRNGATEPVEEESSGDNGWGVFSFMNKTLEDNFIDDDQSHRSQRNDSVLVDTLSDDASMMSADTEASSVSGTAPSSWWKGFESVHSDDTEIRKVVIGPGKLGYTIQSTVQGPMIVGVSEDSSGFRFFGSNVDPKRAKVIKGSIYLGDVIVKVNDTPTHRMKGKHLAKLLLRIQNDVVRTLTLCHREGTGLTTVYQPGPLGSAAVAGVIENAKGMKDDEFDDDGVVGAGYWKMGTMS